MRDHQRIFGAGLHEGRALERAETEGRIEMGQRLSLMASQLSGVERRVYDAIPIQEAWTRQQIVGELMRQGKRIESDTADYALRKMHHNGLVKSPDPGTYQRVDILVRHTPPKEPIMSTIAIPLKPAVKAPSAVSIAVSPLEVLGQLSDKVEAMAAQLHALAGEIEAAAVIVSDQIKEIEERGKKLEQLSQLLADLGVNKK